METKVACHLSHVLASNIARRITIRRIADRYGRSLVLRIQVIVMILACIVMLSDYAMALALCMLGGASLTALLMQHYSDSSLFMVIAIVALIYLLMLLKKSNQRQKFEITM